MRSAGDMSLFLLCAFLVGSGSGATIVVESGGAINLGGGGAGAGTDLSERLASMEAKLERLDAVEAELREAKAQLAALNASAIKAAADGSFKTRDANGNVQVELGPLGLLNAQVRHRSPSAQHKDLFCWLSARHLMRCSAYGTPTLASSNADSEARARVCWLVTHRPAQALFNEQEGFGPHSGYNYWKVLNYGTATYTQNTPVSVIPVGNYTYGLQKGAYLGVFYCHDMTPGNLGVESMTESRLPFSVDQVITLLTLSPTHSLTHALGYLPTYSLTYSFPYSLRSKRPSACLQVIYGFAPFTIGHAWYPRYDRPWQPVFTSGRTHLIPSGAQIEITQLHGPVDSMDGVQMRINKGFTLSRGNLEFGVIAKRIF